MAKRAPSYWRVLLSECENAIFWTRNSSQSTMTETTAKGNDYKPYLVRMMNFIDEPDPPYTNATTFSVEHLSNMTAKDYMRHVNFRVYGVAEPPPGHTLAPMQRTSTVEYQKKAISFYMPNRLMQWNELSLVGNPTRCTEIGDFIRVLRTKETRGQGRPSCARASVDATEFESMHTIMREEGKDSRAKYGFRAFLNVQNHFIARVDDTAKMFLENLQVAHGYDFILKAKLNWGKNVREERDCPFQHMMASNDHRFCCHLTLAVWLEVYLTENAAQGAMTPYVFTFSDNISVPDGAVQSKKIVSTYLRESVFKNEVFAGTQKNRGTHSIRKFSSTATRRNGISKDDKDMRGRWKTRKRVSDDYDDMELPYPDAKVAAVLCPGGPVKYKVRTDANIDFRYILRCVVPKIAAKVGDDVAIVLGKALMWGAFTQPVDSDDEAIMPNWLANRIRDKYRQLIQNDLAPGINPIEKVTYIVTGNEGQVFLDEIPREEQEGPNPGANSVGAGTSANHRSTNTGTSFSDRPVRDQLLALHSQYFQLRHSMDSMRETVQNNHLQTTRAFRTVISNTNRLAMAAPFGRSIQGGGTNGGEGAVGGAIFHVASLSPTPRSLHTLWDEYTVGIGGRKAAMLFTPTERGKCKHTYSHRKKFWDIIDQMVRRGHTAQVAIDGVYSRYGRELSVTNIINLIKRDRRQNTVPAALH
jgi:hypothetical protein